MTAEVGGVERGWTCGGFAPHCRATFRRRANPGANMPDGGELVTDLRQMLGGFAYWISFRN